jgi:hypothetical protein
VKCVVAGERGAPSGPVNRTFFFSPEVGDLLSVGVSGPVFRSKCFSTPSASAKPGVATVLQATEVEEWVRLGVRILLSAEVSMVGRPAVFG